MNNTVLEMGNMGSSGFQDLEISARLTLEKEEDDEFNHQINLKNL